MNFADENEEPVNRETPEESPEVERAVGDVGESSELAGEMEAADEANAADDVSVDSDVEAADVFFVMLIRGFVACSSCMSSCRPRAALWGVRTARLGESPAR